MKAGDSILVTPGAGATVATQLVDEKEHQVMMLADPYGHLLGTTPVYRVFVPAKAVGQNKVFFDLFNAVGSGKTILIQSLVPLVSGAVAVAGAVAVDLFLCRTTAVGTGGTAAALEGVTQTDMNIGKMNPADDALPAGITGRLAPTGGATAGAALSWCSVFPEETNGASYSNAGHDLAARGSHRGAPIVVPEGTGVRVNQGAVASVGNIGFDMLFQLV